MRRLIIFSCLLCILSGFSCQKKTAPDPAKYDSCLEFQIVLRMTPMGIGDEYGPGEDYEIISSNILPIQREGGPGHVISDYNGVVVEICWGDVQSCGDKGVIFTDFKWICRNTLQVNESEKRYWTHWTGPIKPNTQGFSPEFETFNTAVSINPEQSAPGEPQKPPILFFRWRWRPSLPKAPDIDLRNFTADLS